MKRVNPWPGLHLGIARLAAERWRRELEALTEGHPNAAEIKRLFDAALYGLDWHAERLEFEANDFARLYNAGQDNRAAGAEAVNREKRPDRERRDALILEAWRGHWQRVASMSEAERFRRIAADHNCSAATVRSVIKRAEAPQK